jgi:hypothetical protein
MKRLALFVWVALGVGGLSAAGGASAAAEAAETDPAEIPDSEYVQVGKDGHLELRGRRVRFWGHIGHFPNPVMKSGRDPRRDQELMVRRMKDLGFNLHRLWHMEKSTDYVPGDNSADDLRAYGVYLLKKHGIKIWFANLNRRGVVDADKDVHIIDDPATADQWKAAIEAMRGKSWRWKGVQTPVQNIAYVWDARLQALNLRNMEKVAKQTNKYTGIRYADDPDVVVWELTNEEWWMPKMVRGQWLELPAFFQAQLIERWQDFLLEKYGDDAALVKAWQFLMPGESLKERTVMLAPTARPATAAELNDPNPHAREALSEGRAPLGREDFARRRASDVIEFFMGLLIERKAAEAQAVKSWGKSCRLSPLCWDTGTGWQIQCQYLHQHADAVTHCTYLGGKHHDRTDEEFPFNSGLTELPRMCWDVPWVEHNRTPGKPFFVYEIQIRNSTKYRAEFPMRVASLASIQDWDIINWHSYGPGPDATKDEPHTRALEVGHSHDLHYGGDEVQLSAMKAAGEIFKNFLVEPAPNPTTFVYGRTALYHPDSMDYHGSYGRIGRRMLPTTYRHGVRLIIDPTLDDRPDDPLFHGPDGKPDREKYEQFVRTGSMVLGPSVKPRIFEPNAIRPNDQIAYDWRQGFLTFDAPGVAMYTGFYGQLRDPKAGVAFETAGAKLKNVTVENPPNMPYPVGEDERYIAFALTSMEEGKTLAECSRAMISLVSTSFNAGFKMDTSPPLREFFGAGTAEPGGLPVLVARVGADIECPALRGMRWRMLDWNMNEIGRGRVGGRGLRIPAEKPVFFIELERE